MCISLDGARKSSLRVFLSRGNPAKCASKPLNGGSREPRNFQTGGIPIAQLPHPTEKSRDKPPKML
jgi:hypothetical protein